MSTGSSPAAPARGSVLLRASLASALLLAGCGGGSQSTTPTPAKTDIRRPPEAGAVIAAMAALPGGGLRAGELTTGVVRDVLGPGGRRVRGPLLARLPVSTGGQRGLLGLAVDAGGRTFAAYTERGGRERLVVEQILPGPRRRVWTGPPSTDLADGGHLVLGADGRLIVGVGDLQDPARIPDEDTPNGKLLSLDPAGAGGQRPRILSRGWNNPYAFDRVPGSAGALLVADNAPGRRPERIARGDAGGGAPRAVTVLAGRRAPSGLAVIAADEVALCGVRSGRLDRFRLRGGRWAAAGTIERRCSFGVTRLSDGRVAVSTADGVTVVQP